MKRTFNSTFKTFTVTRAKRSNNPLDPVAQQAKQLRIPKSKWGSISCQERKKYIQLRRRRKTRRRRIKKVYITLRI